MYVQFCIEPFPIPQDGLVADPEDMGYLLGRQAFYQKSGHVFFPSCKADAWFWTVLCRPEVFYGLVQDG